MVDTIDLRTLTRDCGSKRTPRKAGYAKCLPMRPSALGRKNYLFMGSASGGRAAAIAYSLIETARFNEFDPQAWLAQILERIPDYKINRIEELLPWNIVPAEDREADA